MTVLFLLGLIVWPALPWIIGGVGVTVAIILWALWFFDEGPITGKRIEVLGPQNSGKTTFLNFLRNKTVTGEATARERYEPFEYKLSNGKTVTIAGGEDIGGGDTFREDYVGKIKESDSIIFIFDIHKYLNGHNKKDKTKDQYVRLTEARFKLVYDHFKDNYPGEIDPHRLVVIGSHRDKLKAGDNKIKGAFYDCIRKNEYKEMFKNFRICDLTNKDELRKIVDSIFDY